MTTVCLIPSVGLLVPQCIWTDPLGERVWLESPSSFQRHSCMTLSCFLSGYMGSYAWVLADGMWRGSNGQYFWTWPPNLPGNPCYQFFLSREASEALLGAETQDEQMLAPEWQCGVQPHADPLCPKTPGYWGFLMEPLARPVDHIFSQEKNQKLADPY